MSIITYFIPYLYLFAAMIHVQNQPARSAVIRVPGGKRVAIPLAVLGLVTTSFTICLSVIPADDEPNKTLAVVKVLGMTFLVLAGGVVTYAFGKRKQLRTSNSHIAVAGPDSIPENGSE